MSKKTMDLYLGLQRSYPYLNYIELKLANKGNAECVYEVTPGHYEQMEDIKEITDTVMQDPTIAFVDKVNLEDGMGGTKPMIFIGGHSIVGLIEPHMFNDVEKDLAYANTKLKNYNRFMSSNKFGRFIIKKLGYLDHASQKLLERRPTDDMSRLRDKLIELYIKLMNNPVAYQEAYLDYYKTAKLLFEMYKTEKTASLSDKEINSEAQELLNKNNMI